MSESKEIIVSTLKISVLPAVISANWEQAEADIKKKIEDKMFLITPETIQSGKDDAAGFRKEDAQLAKDWKTVDELINGDYNKAVSWVKKFRKMYLDGATKISDQVNKIQQETKDLCLSLLVEERLRQWEIMGVTSEFCNANIEDLALLGSINNGKLTKSAKGQVETRCKMDKAEQEKINARLLGLEVRCLKADINPPFKRANIESFLHSSDEMFNKMLDAIINSEIDRKAEAERRMKEKLEREQAAENQRKIDEALAAQQAEANRLAKIDADKQREIEAEAFREKANAVSLELSQSTRRTVVEIKAEEKLKAQLAHAKESYARYPDNDNAETVKNLNEALKRVQKAEEPIEKNKPREQGDYEDYIMTVIITKQFRAEKGSPIALLEAEIKSGQKRLGYDVISCKVKKK